MTAAKEEREQKEVNIEIDNFKKSATFVYFSNFDFSVFYVYFTTHVVLFMLFYIVSFHK